MNINIDVAELDRHINFLTYEASYLRKQAKPWADTKAERIDAILVLLTSIRREKQMTGLGGKRISE